MKSTRKIFSLKGKDRVVRKVMDSLNGFKAMTVLEDVNAESISYVFRCNKSVVCSSKDLCPVGADAIEVLATDSQTMVLGVDDIIKVGGNIVRQFIELAERHKVDIGDHVSNVSCTGPQKSDCVFCKLIGGNPVHEQASLYESENFLVIPGSGAFVDGYLMILPKAHVMSCAELDSQKREELFTVIEDVKFILKSLYKSDVLVWENGSGSGGKGKPKTSIVHAHVHACPSKMNFLETTSAMGIPLKQITREELPKFRENSYLLAMDYDGSLHISYDSELYIPRQYVRQLVALEHGITTELELWNWREYPFWENVEKTGNDVLKFIRDNYEQLSTRIKESTDSFI